MRKRSWRGGVLREAMDTPANTHVRAAQGDATELSAAILIGTA